jgi:hypothetical protein
LIDGQSLGTISVVAYRKPKGIIMQRLPLSVFVLIVCLATLAIAQATTAPADADKPAEPDWSQYDAPILRTVAARLWQRNADLESENASLREQLAAATARNDRLVSSMHSMQRPAAAMPVAPTPQQSATPAQRPTVGRASNQSPPMTMERAQSIRPGMTILEVNRIMGGNGRRTGESDRGIVYEYKLKRYESLGLDVNGVEQFAERGGSMVHVFIKDGRVDDVHGVSR